MFVYIKKIFKWPSLFILAVPILFLIITLITLPDYGVNWDSFVHFARGQSYFNFFLSGKEDFSDLPPLVYTNCRSGNIGLILPSCSKNTSRRSYYQNDYYDYKYWIKNDSGHPPLNDILAATSNYILYQKLGLVNDTLSYHVFILFSSFLLILGVAFFVKSELGVFPAFVSSIVLASYPLFFSESHFNIKDPPEAAFFGLTLIFFYWGILKNNWKLVLISSIAAGLALGTKLNIVFAAFIVFPWFLFHIFKKLNHKFIWERKALIVTLIFYLPMAFGIVYAFWPHLWQDPMRNIFNILGYYSQIGVGTPAEMSKYIFHGWNFYPIYWVVVTTTLPALLLSILGILSYQYFRKHGKISFYFFTMLWFVTPIIRASWPNADIYGGVRQIMEYVPAMAILAGIGAYYLVNLLESRKVNKNLSYLLVFFGLIFSIYEMVKIHPNENIYFNQIVGGLRGAQAKNVPYWGNTYGNVYLQGVKWINENAEKDAKVALPIGVMSNIPRTILRNDLDYSKPNWTGPNRGGEYGIEMYFEWPQKYWYSFQYYDKYLDPVYIYSVEGIPLLKIWENDLAHTKSEFKEEMLYSPHSVRIQKTALGSAINIDLAKNIFITRLTIKHTNSNCQNGLLGYVALSDDGKIWKREPEPITSPQVAPGVNGKIIGWSDTNFVYLFAGKKARFIMLDPQIENSCYLKDFKISVMGLRELP